MKLKSDGDMVVATSGNIFEREICELSCMSVTKIHGVAYKSKAITNFMLNQGTMQIFM